MHKISIPITMYTERFDKEGVLETLKMADAEYLFLALDIPFVKKEDNEKIIARLKKLIPFFQGNGYKVGVWYFSIWLKGFNRETIADYVMKDCNGKLRTMDTPLNSNQEICSGFICPTSEKGVAIEADFIKSIAALSPDIILLDDDFAYGTHMGSFGCYCDRHLKLISDRLGYEISREELSREVLCGKANNVRKEWLSILGETLENYATEIRKAVDSINPNVRIGLCSVMSLWGIDGTTTEKLAKNFAGNTKPFIRLIGAPYWSESNPCNHYLQHVIELERMEYAWIEDKNIEVLTEGDVYPRPRYKVPANILEIFDTALLASNVGDGIHKYMLDYTSKVKYETGYLARHIKNQPIYREIERIFGDKSPTGVRVYESTENIQTMDFTGVENPHQYVTDSFFSKASRMLSDCSIPTTYEENDVVGIAFGENANHLPDKAFDNGLILDIRAAKILMEKGVDIGLESIGENIVNNLLYFPDYDDIVVTGYGKTSAFHLKIKEGAEVLVYSESDGKRFVDAFQYENVNGHKFLVYAFDAAFTDETRYRNYYTQLQLCRSIEWLGGKKMVAKCLGNPDLYMLTSKNDSGLAIGLWNIFTDEIFKPVIELDREYSAAEFVNCSGKLTENQIELSEIPPFGFAFIHLK